MPEVEVADFFPFKKPSTLEPLYLNTIWFQVPKPIVPKLNWRFQTLTFTSPVVNTSIHESWWPEPKIAAAPVPAPGAPYSESTLPPWSALTHISIVIGVVAVPILLNNEAVTAASFTPSKAKALPKLVVVELIVLQFTAFTGCCVITGAVLTVKVEIFE